MTASLAGYFNPAFVTDVGLPASGYRLYTYAGGTTTQKTVYTSASGTTPHTYTSDGAGGQYIALNARGELPAAIWVTSGTTDIVLKTPAGATVWTKTAVGSEAGSNQLSADLADGTSSSKGAALVAFLPSGAGTAASTVQAKLRKFPQASDYTSFANYTTAVPEGAFWSDLGGEVFRFLDRVFVGSATRNDGAQSPAAYDWPNAPALEDGIYQYIPNNAALAVGARGTGLAVAGYGRTSTGAGGGGEAAIGVTGFALNDYQLTNKGTLTVTAGVPSPLLVSSTGTQGDFYTVTSGGALSTPINGITSLPTGSQIRFHNGAWRVGSVGPGAWALYGTVLRTSNKVVGFTHGLEIDVGNRGDQIEVAPANMYAAGATVGVWIGAGGEAAQHGGPAMTASSAAIGIIANDPAVAGFTTGARWVSGIVFQNLSLYGCDGSTGEADALVTSPGHRWTVKNNSGQVVSRILTSNTDIDKAKRLQFSHFGLLLLDDTTGKTQFQVDHVAASVNFVSLKPNVAANAPEIRAFGDDADIDLVLRAKGTGTLALFCGSQTTVGAAGAASALPANPVGYMKLIVNGTLRAVPYYNV